MLTIIKEKVHCYRQCTILVIKILYFLILSKNHHLKIIQMYFFLLQEHCYRHIFAPFKEDSFDVCKSERNFNVLMKTVFS